MRLFIFILLVFSLTNCKGKNSTVNSKKSAEKQLFNLENCEVNTQCSLEIIPNSSLLIQQDKLQNSHIEFEESHKNIIKYEFKRNSPPNTVDGHYSELVYFEIDNNSKQLHLINEDLQKVKMIYGRFCYCKDGTSGYFKVNEGTLKLVRKNNELTIDLDFKVGKIPQLLTQIKETVKLN